MYMQHPIPRHCRLLTGSYMYVLAVCTCYMLHCIHVTCTYFIKIVCFQSSFSLHCAVLQEYLSHLKCFALLSKGSRSSILRTPIL